MKRFVAILLLACFPAVVLADEMKLIPPWQKKQCPTETYACYDFEQAKALVVLDLDLQLQLEKCTICEIDKAALTTAVTDLQKAATLLDENVKILDKRVTEKQVIIGEQAAVIIRLERRDVFGKALPWVIVVVLTAAAGGFLGGYVLGHK